MTQKLIEYKPNFCIKSWISIERDRKFLENKLHMKYIEQLEKQKIACKAALHWEK